MNKERDEDNWELIKELAEVLGYININPYYAATYLEDAIKELKKYFRDM